MNEELVRKAEAWLKPNGINQIIEEGIAITENQDKEITSVFHDDLNERDTVVFVNQAHRERCVNWLEFKSNDEVNTNEQKKRELMLRFAAENKGVWPELEDPEEAGEGEPLLLLALIDDPQDGARSGDFFANGFDGYSRLHYESVCTRTEFEGLIQSLFEGAPDGAEYWHPNSKMFYVKHGWTYAVVDGENTVYHGAQLDESVHDLLIPRPRKQGNAEKWQPTIGEECLITVDEFNLIDKECVPKYLGDVVVFLADGDEFGCKKESAKFRPLKTEAELKREKDIQALADFMQKNSVRKIKAVATAIYNELGWRPND